MLDVYELYTIKSKDHETKKQILDTLTAFCMESDKIDLLSIAKKDEVLDIKDETSEEIIRLCLLSIYASDIATVPYHKSRDMHLKYLKEIVEEYGLSYKKVIYLSKYAEEFFHEIKKNQIA